MKIDVLLPIAAPAPAGLIIGVQLYKATIDTVGAIPPDWSLFVHGAAGLFAAVGCAGMIGAEIVAYKQAGVAFAEKQTGAAIISLVAGVVCSGLVIWAVSTGNKPQAVIASVVVSIAGYVALAARDFLARRRGVIASVETSADKDKNFTLAMEKQKTAQQQAAARLARASAAPSIVQSVSSGQTKPSIAQLDPVTLEAARVYFTANPAASAREWIASGSCPVKSPTTASAYKKAVTP